MINVDWIGFILASIAVVLAPGPGSMFVAKTAGAKGGRAGRMAMLGIMLGDACLITLSLLGVSALFRAHPVLFHGVRLAGAGYLIFLGLQAIIFKKNDKSEVSQDSVLSLRQALTITLLNPKAVFFFMTFFPLFIQSAKDGLLFPYISMSVVFMLISLTYLSILSRVSSRIGVAFQASYRIQSIVRKTCGCLFIGFGIKVAVSTK
jgi:leucine efflux protein